MFWKTNIGHSNLKVWTNLERKICLRFSKVFGQRWHNHGSVSCVLLWNPQPLSMSYIGFSALSMNPLLSCLDHVGVSYPGFDLCDTSPRQGVTARMEMGYFPPYSYFSLFFKPNLNIFVLFLKEFISRVIIFVNNI